MCFLSITIAVHNNAYSASRLDDLFSGRTSIDEILDNMDRARLKGINDVYIVIENISDDARRLGINEDNTRTAVEIKIRKSGIRVKGKGSLIMFYVKVGD
jgi:hypothetical protein